MGHDSRELVHRGVLVPGKGKRTMADVRRSLSGGWNIRPVGLVRRSMPALVEPEHAVGISLVVVKQQIWMPIRVMGDAQPIARKRLVFLQHLISPARHVMDPTSDAVQGRLIVEGSAVPLMGEHGTHIDISTNVNIVAMGSL